MSDTTPGNRGGGPGRGPRPGDGDATPRSFFRDGGSLSATGRPAVDESDQPTRQQPVTRAGGTSAGSQVTPSRPTSAPRSGPAPSVTGRAPAPTRPAPVAGNDRTGSALSPDRQEQPASPVKPLATGRSSAPAESSARSAAGSSTGTSAEPPAGPTRAERIMNRLPPPSQSRASGPATGASASAANRQPPSATSGSAPSNPAPARSGPSSATSEQETPMPQPTTSSNGGQRDRSGGAVSRSADSANTTTVFRTQPPGRTGSPAARTGAAAAGAGAGAGAAGGAASARSATETVDLGPQEFPAGPPATKSGQSDARPAVRRTRKARLRLARVDPWSVMKTFFLFSIAGGIMACVAVGVVFTVIEGSGLFDSLDGMVSDVLGSGNDTPFQVRDYLNFNRVMGVTAFLACIDVVILTALATLGSFLYNLSATMLGGFEVTLAED